ncbi:MAG: lysophospholipid acyltransferase family protein [Desulfobacteraceae bacterium]|nr:lysophospholipid acyltransferase family protein [Desulfobacteraceae bacterium]
MKNKSKSLQWIEYAGFLGAVRLTAVLPPRVLRAASSVLGSIVYALSSKRRNIAIRNVTTAFGDTMSRSEIRRLARRSCACLFLTAIEIVRSPFSLKGKEFVRDERYGIEHLKPFFEKAKRIHDEADGCIFVTPHLGSWELLPHLGALIGIPLTVIVRPLDNPYLERDILSVRIATGQIMVPKKNAMFSLERLLRRGRSIGMLPDQSTGRGLHVEFFGKKASTTPLPALLGIKYHRPVVVVAIYRTEDPYRFEASVSDPIWSDPDMRDEKSEMVRITREVNRCMEELILKHPEQYLWMHNRWKESHRRPVFGATLDE